MGLMHAALTLKNPRREEMPPLQVTALVDTGALTLCIPPHVAAELDLEELEKRSVTTAGGRRVDAPYVGPVQITFGNRSCFAGAFVLGDQVLLGAVPMEDMDLVINLARGEVTVNPESPHVATGIVTAASGRP